MPTDVRSVVNAQHEAKICLVQLSHTHILSLCLSLRHIQNDTAFGRCREEEDDNEGIKHIQRQKRSMAGIDSGKGKKEKGEKKIGGRRSWTLHLLVVLPRIFL